MISVKFIPGFLKTGLAKISTHSTTWQFKTIKLIQRPIKSLYLTPGSKLMVPRSIPTTSNLKWRKIAILSTSTCTQIPNHKTGEKKKQKKPKKNDISKQHSKQAIRQGKLRKMFANPVFITPGIRIIKRG